MNQRLISFGQSTIGITFGQGRPAAIVDFLFRAIPHGEGDKPWTMLRLEDHGDGQGFWLWQDEKLLSKNDSFESMAGTLMSQVCFTLAYESNGGLLLHSAAVLAKEIGVILPGKSGAGKSTLTAWFIENGCRYLSDEMVFFADGRTVFSGFSRPITIKSPARHLIADLLRENQLSDGMIQSDTLDMVSPQLFGAEVVKGLAPLNLIIFPNFHDGQSFELVHLSKAQTAFELMKCLANARNLDGHGLPEAVRLANTTPAYSLRYEDTERAGRSIMGLVAEQNQIKESRGSHQEMF